MTASESSYVTHRVPVRQVPKIVGGKLSVAQVEDLANTLIRRTARGTVDTRNVRIVMPGAGGRLDGEIVLRHVATPGPVPSSVRTVRASLSRVSGTQQERFAALKQYDDEIPEGAQGRTFYRNSARLKEAVDRASTLKDPSFRIYGLQRDIPLSFGGGPPGPERPLKPAGLVMANHAARLCGGDEVYRRHAVSALELGDFTTHDPDTLHPRFLEYVHERTTSVPPEQHQALNWAVKVMKVLWRKRGINVEARDSASASPEKLAEIMNPGSSGEYRECGAVGRTDPEVLELCSKSIMRYFKAGHACAQRSWIPPWVNYTQQPVMSFGKKEAKAAKISGGKRVAPVPRFIFNPSPINYSLAAFLHSDLSHQAQDRDPTHGPGFGPGRGRAWKLLDKVMRHARKDGSMLLDCDAIMSDIAKWDANMSEVLIGAVFDLMEDSVDKSKLNADARAARQLMATVAKRQLMRKLIEHPSGYLLELFGCMPSGSFYTSCVNTIGNDLLALSLLGVTIMRSGRELSDVDVGDVADAAIHDLVSYGDNQLIFSTLFSTFGVSYDVGSHEEHLAHFGMKLKVDETDVSNRLCDVRFCSRGVIMTPSGLAITRSHTSIYNKIGGRVETDQALNKLYIRALMVDLLGTDPIMYQCLKELDESIDVPMDYKATDPKVIKTIEPFARRMFGDGSAFNISRTVDLLRDPTVPDRRVLLSLRLPPSEGLKTFGPSLMVRRSSDRFVLDGPGEWLAERSPQEFWEYLVDTGQTGVIYNN